jgi:hypothetical protein
MRQGFGGGTILDLGRGLGIASVLDAGQARSASDP